MLDLKLTLLVKRALGIISDNLSISVQQNGDNNPQNYFSNEILFFRLKIFLFIQTTGNAMLLVQVMHDFQHAISQNQNQ